MFILGINSVYHECSACLMEDGRVVAAVEEERLSRTKHAKKALYSNPHYLPYRAIAFCLKEAKIPLTAVSHIGYSFVPEERLAGNICQYDDTAPSFRYRRNLEEILFYSLLQTVECNLTSEGAENVSKSLIHQIGMPETARDLRKNTEFHFLNHHLCHAAAAYYPSGYDHAAVLTVDGIGEKSSTWMGVGEGLSLKRIKTIDYPNSLGFFYERFTEFLGFEKNNDEYKVAGLAAYGNMDPLTNRFYRLIRDHILEFLPEGEIRINNDIMRFRQPLRESGLERLFGPARPYGGRLEIDGRHADIAAALQLAINEAVLHMARFLHSVTGAENLAYAGGVALNCVTNMKLLTQGPFSSLFIQPAANDAGTALGAALYIAHGLLGFPRQPRMTSVALGPHFSNDEIEQTLKKYKLPYRRSTNLVAETAGYLVDNKVVAWFQGRLEWGPRALGNRSILGNPCDETIRQKLNEIKGREDFRPLAPSVLAERQSDWFVEEQDSPFMLLAFSSKDDPIEGSSRRKWIPAALHVDGTSRLQTVHSADHPLYHALLTEFARLTEERLGIPGGIPMVVNTSFNTRGKPIVATVDDALQCFFTEPIDVLVIGHFILEKTATE